MRNDPELNRLVRANTVDEINTILRYNGIAPLRKLLDGLICPDGIRRTLAQLIVRRLKGPHARRIVVDAMTELNARRRLRL